MKLPLPVNIRQEYFCQKLFKNGTGFDQATAADERRGYFLRNGVDVHAVSQLSAVVLRR